MDIVDIIYFFDLILHILDYLVQLRYCFFRFLMLEVALGCLGLVGQHLLFEIVAAV